MNKNIIIIVIVLALVLVGILWWFPITPKLSPQTAGTPLQSQPEDTTATITKELDSIDINSSSNTDFIDVNKNIESL